MDDELFDSFIVELHISFELDMIGFFKNTFMIEKNEICLLKPIHVWKMKK